MKAVLESKIIVVEDSFVSREVICKKLRGEGFLRIDGPETSVEAWEMIANGILNDEPYDLVITDLNMPDLDGIDLIFQIKEDPMSKKTKIIVVSADADENIINRVMDIGAEAYFTKPLKMDTLISKIKEVI